jgi:hypothetical protein
MADVRPLKTETGGWFTTQEVETVTAVTDVNIHRAEER